MMGNSGQTCSAPSRMLVPHAAHGRSHRRRREAAEQVTVGDPNGDFAHGAGGLEERSSTRSRDYIQKGIDEGATLVAGGPGRPDGLDKGYYVKPTVFADVNNDMTIAREEIFGPVLMILGYDDIDQAVEIANDTEFGLAGYVVGGGPRRRPATSPAGSAPARSAINGGFDFNAPFGGYKSSGNGREWGEFGFHEYLEIKGVLGHAPDAAQ